MQTQLGAMRTLRPLRKPAVRKAGQRARVSGVRTCSLTTRDILARPGIEGDMLSFLNVSEAYWKVGACTRR